MNFLFNLFNHSDLGRRSLEDVITIIGHQLRALGHNVLWLDSNERTLTRDHGYNVIVEGFTPGSIAVIKDAYEQGCRFICIATEEPTLLGFNHGRDREMVLRQARFVQAAQYFDGILHLVPGQNVTRWY